MTLLCTKNNEDYLNAEKPHLHNNITYNIFEHDIAALIGVDAAILFNQIKYWISKCGREIKNEKGKWIYNSLPQWNKQFSYWSMYKIRKAIKLLEDLKLIKSTKANSKKWNHTKWYTVDYNEYKKLLQHQNRKTNKQSITKTALSKINPLVFNKKSSARPNCKEHSFYKEYRSTDRSVENQQIIITKNSYTNNISSNKEFDMNLNNTSDKKLEEIQIDSNEKEIVVKMIHIWNKVFECSINPIKAYGNQKNQQTLLQLYKIAFNSDLDNWREYALKVNSSQFLMGEKETRNNFKAVFSWLIKEVTIEKIQNGEYGVGDRELDMNNVSKNIEEKKEEMVNKMDKKISEYMKLNIDETKERKEFDEYVKTYKNEIKNDEYGILGVTKHISYYSLFKTSEYKGLKESLYESYVMKKYLGVTKIEVRKKLREKTKMLTIEGIKSSILEELKTKEILIEKCIM